MKIAKFTKLNGNAVYLNVSILLSFESATTKKGIAATVIHLQGLDVWVKESPESIIAALGLKGGV